MLQILNRMRYAVHTLPYSLLSRVDFEILAAVKSQQVLVQKILHMRRLSSSVLIDYVMRWLCFKLGIILYSSVSPLSQLHTKRLNELRAGRVLLELLKLSRLHDFGFRSRWRFDIGNILILRR